MDQGVPGQYNASHAEKQSIVNNPEASQVAVSRDMCGDCQAYYQQEAIAQNRPITVSDPTTVRTFNPDGTVISTPVSSGDAAPTITPDSTPTDE